MAIRYDKKLENEINKTIRNFNSKVKRLEKQERQLIPNKVTKEQLKESYETRTELLRKLKELQRFGKRGAEEIITTKGGVNITKYELENLKRTSARVKYNLTKEINRLKVTRPKIFGREQDVTFAEMGDERFLTKLETLKGLKKDITKLSKAELEKYIGRLGREAFYQSYERSKFKDSYFTMLEDLAYFYKYDKEKLQAIKEKLYSLKPEKFLKAFNTDKSIKAIVDYYPIITKNKHKTGINPLDVQGDVSDLLDNLYNNIDNIVSFYE